MWEQQDERLDMLSHVTNRLTETSIAIGNELDRSTKYFHLFTFFYLNELLFIYSFIMNTRLIEDETEKIEKNTKKIQTLTKSIDKLLNHKG